MFDNIILTIIFRFDPSWEFAQICLMRTTRIPTLQCSSLAKALADCCALWLKLRKSGSTACIRIQWNAKGSRRCQVVTLLSTCNSIQAGEVARGQPESQTLLPQWSVYVSWMSHEFCLGTFSRSQGWEYGSENQLKNAGKARYIMPTSYVHNFEELQCVPACVL